MKRRIALLLPIPILVMMVVPCAWGAEPPLTIETILARWEEASRKCRTFDIEFCRLSYDHVFALGNGPQREEGRFCMEAPDRARYEIFGSDVFVWSGGGLLFIDPARKTYWKWSSKEVELARQRLREMGDLEKLPWWQRFGLIGVCWLLSSQPEDLLPLVGQMDAENLRERFDFRFEQRDKDIFLTALPRSKEDEFRFGKIDIILDAESYMVRAHRIQAPGGRRHVVHVFCKMTVNQPPTDAQSLLKPDLKGLRDTSCPPGAAESSTSRPGNASPPQGSQKHDAN